MDHCQYVAFHVHWNSYFYRSLCRYKSLYLNALSLNDLSQPLNVGPFNFLGVLKVLVNQSIINLKGKPRGNPRWNPQTVLYILIMIYINLKFRLGLVPAFQHDPPPPPHTQIHTKCKKE